jgi:glucosamine-6-phosphate deaminase
MQTIDSEELYEWCKIPLSELEKNPRLKIPLRICSDSLEMGKIMARELVDEINNNNKQAKETRAIIPCGPSCWYSFFTGMVNPPLF